MRHRCALRCWIAAVALLVLPVHAQIFMAPGVMQMPGMPGMPGAQGRAAMPAVDCKQLEAVMGSGAAVGGMDMRGLMATMGCGPPQAAQPQEKPARSADCASYRSVLTDVEGVNTDWLGPLPVMAARALAERCGDTAASLLEQRARPGFMRFAEGRFAESAQAFGEAAAQASGIARTRYTIEAGKSLVAANRTEDAQKIFAEALSGAPAASPMRNELLVLLAIIDLAAKNDAAALERLVEVEKTTQAQAAAQKIDITFNPAFYRHAPYYAMALARTGRTTDARAVLERIVNGREQFVGMADQAQQVMPMVQEVLSSFGMGAIVDVPQASRGLANVETSKLMMGEMLALNLACSTLEALHLDANQPERALEAAERCRGRALARLLANRAFHPTTRTAFPTHPEIEAYAKQNRLDYRQAGEKLIQERMGTPQVDAASRPATIDDMRRMAKERKATLVVYSITYVANRLPNRMPDRETGVTIWVVSPDGTVSARRRSFEGVLPDSTLTLTSAALRAHEALGVPGRGAATAQSARDELRDKRAAAALRQFHRLLVEPVDDLLPKAEGARVIFVPQGPLFLVPFAALEDAQGAPLVARYAISVAPSLQTLALTGARKAAARGTGAPVIVGNPVMPKLPSAPGEPPVTISPLPGAEREANAIATLLKTNALTGASATKSAVMGRVRDARYVHLATHGFLEDTGVQGANPNLREVMILEERDGGGHKTPGMLALAPSGNDSGMLTADEIAEAATTADLVVMSACGSGQGAINDDGVIGLSRAWMAAGAPSVVVSLWAIPDEPTRDLMVAFYSAMAEGSGKAEALRTAMLATRAKYPSPVNWAAFVLLGEPD